MEGLGAVSQNSLAVAGLLPWRSFRHLRPAAGALRLVLGLRRVQMAPHSLLPGANGPCRRGCGGRMLLRRLRNACGECGGADPMSESLRPSAALGRLTARAPKIVAGSEEGGLRRWWNGSLLGLATSLPQSAIWWMVYENSKSFLLPGTNEDL